ncbi:hypothetical protein [Bacillus sp. J33]|uniref:hypothetical protein n=1 Tax=Bacillus sp. J33 TaxID=935836 RepID=UPI0006864234|nr:hypothetical protein [Bacillus sp. J33]
MAELFSVGSSVPSNGNTPITIDISEFPTRLAAFGLSTPSGANRVFLNATVGVRPLLLNPVVVFQVIRDNSVVVATIRQQLLLAANEVQNVSFNIVDNNAPLGSHGYALTAELEGMLSDATIVGPIIFSGASYPL